MALLLSEYQRRFDCAGAWGAAAAVPPRRAGRSAEFTQIHAGDALSDVAYAVA